MKMLFFPSRAMTPTAAEPIRPEVVAGPAEVSRPRPWRQVAAGLAVATVLEIVLWGILSAVNRRSLAYLVDQNEITAGVFALACGITGAIVLWRRPRHLLGWLFVVVAQLAGLADLLAEYAARRPTLPLATPALFIGEYIWLPGLAISAALFTPLFPDGQPASPRWRPLIWAGGACVALVSLPLIFLNSPDLAPRRNPIAAPVPVQHVLWGVVIGGLLGALACGIVGAVLLAVRMVRARGHERRRLGWFFAAFAVVGVARALPVNPVVPAVAVGFLPVALGIAMLRHRLFDGDRLLNRTLVYTVLTIAVAGVFGLTVGLASGALGGDGTGAVLAAVVIALGLAPARNLVQRGVDRFLYGQSRDPYAALTGLGRQLSATIAADEVLPAVVSTVRGALRLPYVAVTLAGDTQPSAADGEPAAATVELPLRHAGAEVGRLTVGLRDGQRFLDPGDERLLQGFAQQAGVAADGVRLNHDLRRSRDELAVARDEERHRIRRDLHDGLGPTLAGVALGLGAARRSVAANAPETADLLGSMETEVKGSLADVKRLVADLRPTTLEQLGLAEALQRYAETVTQRSEGALKVRIELPDVLPPLPSAVEVAAYRIVLEAVTNVARHAGASRCTVAVTVTDGSLCLAVTDNGCGLPPAGQPPGHRPQGLGLRSMAERATELGGQCTVGAARDRGTRVAAAIPLGPAR
jgi:two-component system, NarL family, sensor kinase